MRTIYWLLLMPQVFFIGASVMDGGYLWLGNALGSVVIVACGLYVRSVDRKAAERAA